MTCHLAVTVRDPLNTHSGQEFGNAHDKLLLIESPSLTQVT